MRPYIVAQLTAGYNKGTAKTLAQYLPADLYYVCVCELIFFHSCWHKDAQRAADTSDFLKERNYQCLK